MGSLSDYPLSAYCTELGELLKQAGREQEKGGEALATHYGEMVFTPYILNDYGGRYLLSPGRQNLPTYLAGLAPKSESAIIKGLISELNSKLVAGLGPDPNFSHSGNRPSMFCAFRDGTIEKALLIGGSNACKLASSTSMLGVDSYCWAGGGS